MPRIPDADDAFIAFARLHADLWSGQGTAPTIGLSPEQITETLAATAAAEAADVAAQQARSASKAATAAKRQAIATLEGVFAADVATIDAHALATKDPGVYTRAQIDAPKTPSERPAPPAPTDLRATVQSNGSVVLSFKATTGGGATYLVQRLTTSIQGVESPYEFVGFASDDKRYIDTAVPEGVRSIGYRVAARISTGLQSPWSVTRTVPFGSQNNGPIGRIAPMTPEDHKAAG